MRKVVLVSLLLLAACSKRQEGADSTGSQNLSNANIAAGPNVGVSVAPGLAVTYEYGFRLAAEKIAATQEDNASQCEALGPATCRVSGMSYRVERNRSVTGALELKLAPAAARKFGKQSVDTVIHHGGMLASAEIASENAGETIANAQADKGSYDEERARIEKQLAQSGLGSGERRDLQARLAQLTEAARQVQATQAGAAAKLANTPVTLRYESGDVDQSLSDGPIYGAIKDGFGNIVASVSVLLTLFVSLLPWLALGGAGFWAWRKLQLRFGKGNAG